MAALSVLSLTESFSALWPQLAAELEVSIQVASTPGELGPSGEAMALVIAVAGREEEAERAVREARAAGMGAPLVVGARSDHRLAVTLLQSGAANYFSLPADLEALRVSLGELTRRQRARQARVRLAAAERSAFDFSRIIGRSPQLQAALERAARVIPHDRTTVLITGETGTGKELLAQAVHYNGPRATGPFVELNCAAIPGNLLEAELFGYERGAFTDARSAKPGLFEAADGGTLFLDEVGHLPLELQGKLLKSLEEKRLRRVGALATRTVDVRIIAATHVELEEAVRRREFREDLYYRLSIIPIHLPPLRQRGEDVLLLAEHFLQTLASQYGLPSPVLTADLQRILLAHTWPGNVRELRNALERALLLGDSTLRPDDLFATRAGAPASAGAPLPFPAPLADIERAAARVMLERLAGNKKAAADALGISRSRLYRLLESEPLAEAPSGVAK